MYVWRTLPVGSPRTWQPFMGHQQSCTEWPRHPPLVTSVASTPTTGGGVQIVPAVRWCCVAVTAVMALEQPPAHQDLPAREQEVIPLSVSCSR
jgi:hypothetical protein